MSEEVTAPGSRPGKGHRLTDHTSRTAPPRLHWRTVLPALGVSLSAFLLFGLQLPGWGHALLVVSLAAAWWSDRELGKDLRSEERRVGDEGRTGGAVDNERRETG